MAYVTIETVLVRHRKINALARELKVEPAQAVGHMVSLWANVLELQEDGDISKWNPEDIARYSLWTGDPQAYIKALLNNGDGFLEKIGDKLLIHDWLDYMGKYLKSKYRTHNPGRLEEIKLKHQRHTKGRPKTDQNQSSIALDKIRLDKIINTYVRVIDYFNQKAKKKFTLTPQRKNLIEKLLKDGHTETEIFTAIDNFCKDDWPERYKYMDPIYCLGVIRGVDNFDKWFNYKPVETKHPLEMR